jgi:hypothetical protein
MVGLKNEPPSSMYCSPSDHTLFLHIKNDCEFSLLCLIRTCTFEMEKEGGNHYFELWYSHMGAQEMVTGRN